jgi:hypothetical protein
MLLQLGLFLIALIIFVILLSINVFLYDRIAKLCEKKPIKPVLKPQNKPVIRLARTAEKEVINQIFTVEIKGSKDLKVLTKENFKELLSPYFIAVDYLLQLWLESPFNLIITDRIQEHYGKEKTINGFIRFRQIPEIYIKASTTSKHRTGILIHEIAHQRSEQEAKLKKAKIQDHGKEFKRHMRILFKPLLVDKTYYKKHHELSYHLAYEARKYSPAKDICI